MKRDEIKEKYNVEAWNWKQNLISKRFKKIKKIKIKFDIKMKLNQMIRDKIKKKIN
jgi:hypothetical protein